MIKITRSIAARLKKTRKSVLLLGPRQVGKSTLIRGLKPDIVINLADEEQYLAFARNPGELRQRLEQKSKISLVAIDEVQRLPGLLNTIQALIDESSPNIKFLLTGSSARKLRRGQANLLPGRLIAHNMGPLVAKELDYNVSLKQILSTGSLPGIYTAPSNEEREAVLRSYAAIYLKEEIQAEALSRNIEGFARFLFLAAATSTNFLDLTKLSSEAMIPYETARRYFEILEDTLIVHRASAFAKSARKRLIQHPRFYFFDVGVLNGLLENFSVSEDRKGMLFETLIFTQILHSAHAQDLPIRISSYRTEGDAEIDLIVEINKTTYAIEVKSATKIAKINKRSFESFRNFYGNKFVAIVCYAGSEEKMIDDIEVLPWQKMLQRLGL
jgi:predicted AAA+ superfamily ATPase